uniref:Uncharacterized protein n=1 Tax=Anopheles coluzzii TaxID=1518534 RepID=A0A8W7PVT5_ANOCL
MMGSLEKVPPTGGTVAAVLILATAVPYRWLVMSSPRKDCCYLPTDRPQPPALAGEIEGTEPYRGETADVLLLALQKPPLKLAVSYSYATIIRFRFHLPNHQQPEGMDKHLGRPGQGAKCRSNPGAPPPLLRCRTGTPGGVVKSAGNQIDGRIPAEIAAN